MSFSENIKLEAKRKSHFKCCVCQSPFVEVHHIIPQEEDGPDSIDNAAPLCGGCHHKYGGNPELRKQLREMRDHWWALCENQNVSPDMFEKIDALGNKVEEVKSLLIPFMEDKLEKMKEAHSVDGLSSYFSAMTSGTLVIFQAICPNCKRPMRALGHAKYQCDHCG